MELIFRPSRFTPAELNIQEALAQYADLDGHTASGRLANVSSSGAAFELPPNEVLRNGQVIESFSVRFDGLVVYSGRVQVINQRDVDGSTIVGIAFMNEYIPPSELDGASKMAASLREIGQKLAYTHQLLDAEIDDWVKILTADFGLLLTSLQEAFDSTVPANASHEIEEGVIKAVEARVAERFHGYIRRMNELPKRVPPEQSQAVRDYMKRHIQPLLMPAPIYRQSFFKPLGYAGDYVTMNIAYTNHYQGETPYAKFLNRMFCDITISRAAIARVSYLQDWIDEIVRAKEEGLIRIASIASGPAREVQDYLTETASEGSVEITLFDQDAKALAFAQSMLAKVVHRFGGGVQLKYINGAVKHLVKEPDRFASMKGQDLIYSAGLFDYLRPKAAKLLLANLFEMLAPGGWLVAGNLCPLCDSQGFLENLVDWEIVYRTDDDLLALASGIPARSVRIECDATGANKFLVMQR